MKTLKKLASLILIIALLLTSVSALAATVEPEETEDMEHLAGKSFPATVGEYNDLDKTLQLFIYARDCYDDDDIAKIAAGDILLAGGRIHRVKAIGTLDGDRMVTCEDGEEIIFTRAWDDDDDMIACSTDDDRIYMHCIGVVYLPAAADITLTDRSDPDRDQPVIIKGLDDILKIKAEKEETSNGLDYYAVTVTLDRDLQIKAIEQVFDVAQ